MSNLKCFHKWKRCKCCFLLPHSPHQAQPNPFDFGSFKGFFHAPKVLFPTLQQNVCRAGVRMKKGGNSFLLVVRVFTIFITSRQFSCVLPLPIRLLSANSMKDSQRFTNLLFEEKTFQGQFTSFGEVAIRKTRAHRIEIKLAVLVMNVWPNELFDCKTFKVSFFLGVPLTKSPLIRKVKHVNKDEEVAHVDTQQSTSASR